MKRTIPRKAASQGNLQRCVNKALSADAFGRFKCYDMLLENVKELSAIGYADVCGKCLVAVPCSYTNPVMKFVHEMLRDETDGIVARTTLKGVHMDTASRKSCAFPEAIAARAHAMLGGCTQV